jgi:hypothetical protein
LIDGELVAQHHVADVNGIGEGGIFGEFFEGGRGIVVIHGGIVALGPASGSEFSAPTAGIIISLLKSARIYNVIAAKGIVTGKQKSHIEREKRIDQTLHLSGKRRGALLKEEVWYEGTRVVKYSLAYINARMCAVDNERVLGFDNTHQYHHRHFMGGIEKIEFHGYEALVARFERELYALWRAEDDD